MQFLNKLDVCQKLKCSKTTIHNYVKDGLLPPAITMNGKSKWYEHEIDAVMKFFAEGKSNDLIRTLVKTQVVERLI